MIKLNCQRHECTKSEGGVTHLVQFSVLEGDLEVTEKVYEIGVFVKVFYKAPSRVMELQGIVKGFEFVMDVYDGPYVTCVLVLEEVEQND